MVRISCSAAGWKAAGLLLLAPWFATGCASTDSGSKTGMAAFGAAPAASTESSWTDKLTSPFKSGAAAITGENRTATANDSDQLSLSKKVDKKNPDLIVAIAQMHERSGNFEEAEKEYKKALKLKPKHQAALMGYAHLQDRRNKLEEAAELYQKAIAAHPKEAAIYNDLGLCYHRRNMLPEAQGALTKAIELAPDRKLYRNNLAAVMVEQGQIDVALAQLTAAHGAAAAHYNLGYLLAKKGNQAGALVHFQQAAILDPSLTAAQQWVAKLSPPPSQPPTSPAFAGADPWGNPATQAPAFDEVPPADASPQYLKANAPGGNYQGVQNNPWAAPPAAVRYPDQPAAGYTGTATLPPSPNQYRQ